MSEDTPRHTRLAEARQARIDRPEVKAACEQTRLRYELGEAVRLRREELGWSHLQLAERGRDEPAGCRPVRGWRHHSHPAAAGTAGRGARLDPHRQPRPVTAPLLRPGPSGAP